MIERVLVIVNEASGVGCPPGLAGRLAGELRDAARIADLELVAVRDHQAARLAATAFLQAYDRPAAVIVGGGGGTVRAAVEGFYGSSAGGRVVFGALRMGSGNVVARSLGMARDPLEGMRQVAAALRCERTAPVAAMRCRKGTASGAEVRRAVVMCGLGQWGRCAGDLARWRRRSSRLRASVASLTGVERVNHAEYVAAASLRLLRSVASPRSCELVEVAWGGVVERLRLLAGAVVTTRVPGLPLQPGSAVIVPLGGPPRRLRLREGEALRITLLDRLHAGLFLDEDPETFHRELAVDIAGSLPFLTAEPAR